MYEVSKEVYAKQYPYASFPDTPDESFKQVIIRAALEQAYSKLPDRDKIVEIAREYVDLALSYGSPPVKYVRALMLGEQIPKPAN
jgi:hypothetical protein